jgi:hypothetical protein
MQEAQWKTIKPRNEEGKIKKKTLENEKGDENLWYEENVKELKIIHLICTRILHKNAMKVKNLRFCRIWGFHGGDYEEYRLLGCSAV